MERVEQLRRRWDLRRRAASLVAISNSFCFSRENDGKFCGEIVPLLVSSRKKSRKILAAVWVLLPLMAW